ncbi:MAG: hypothetical protein U0670_02970 [Anaerolineae bacterium]
MGLNGRKPKMQPAPEPHDADVRAFLEGWRMPESDPAAKTRLIMALKNVPLSPAWIEPPRLSRREKLSQAVLILRAQVRVVGWLTWIASLIVIAFGVLVTLLLADLDSAGLPLVIVAPLVTALGVAFIYGEDADPSMEIQQAAPVSPQVLLLARLMLLFGFDLALSLLGSLFLTVVSAQFTLMPLILSWLVPMAFLSALAFVLSVLFFDPLGSVLIAIGVWGALVVRHYLTLPLPVSTPDLLSAELRPLVLASAAGLLVIALWWAGRDQRYLRSEHD